MSELNFRKMRVAFQGEPGAFSEAAAVELLGEEIRPVPRATCDATFRAIAEGADYPQGALAGIIEGADDALMMAQ